MFVLSKTEADVRIQEVILELRNSIRVGRHWRRSAWDELYGVICKEAPLVYDGGPLASLLFAALVGLAIEYLGEKEKRDRARLADLRSTVKSSMRGLEQVMQMAWQTGEESAMVTDAKRICAQHLLNIETHCPVSS